MLINTPSAPDPKSCRSYRKHSRATCIRCTRPWDNAGCRGHMSTHVSTVIKACFAALRLIRSVRRSIPRRALLTLIRAPVVSKVDYCNSVLRFVWHPAKTVAVRIDCCRTAGILGQKVGTHHCATPWTQLVKSSWEDKVSVLCSVFLMPSWYCATVPRRDLASDS